MIVCQKELSHEVTKNQESQRLTHTFTCPDHGVVNVMDDYAARNQHWVHPTCDRVVP